jgi:Amt family ammonium transporter
MITGVCDDVNVHSALFIGFFAAFIYLWSAQLLERYRVDDPVEAVQIHGICGFFGVLNVGIFGNKHGILTNPENSFWQIGI